MRKYVKWVGITGLDLKKHQVDGVRWCLERESVNVGGIIADEMGLGKTMQIISLFLLDQQQKQYFYYLIIQNILFD